MYTDNVRRKRTRERKETMELTLEQEFMARVFMHKTVLTSSIIAQDFIEEQSKGEVTIPSCMLLDQATEYSNTVVRTALQRGTLDDLYNDAWERLKDTMPEHTKVI